MIECYQINRDDNVATLLGKADIGPVLVHGPDGRRVVAICEPIDLGHKVALCYIPANSAVVKYGVMIGNSTKNILEGEWVHLHNCTSCIDEESIKLDIRTGLPIDKHYG